MKIANRNIGNGERPFVVAEISGNHCGQIDLAKLLIKMAKTAGADAVKTQCYDPDSMTLDIKKPDFIVQDGLWKGRSLYDLYTLSHTPPAWHKELYNVARQEGITIFSSVFDQRGVDLLEDLGCPAFKIASFEITDIPLITYAAKTRKPIIISTGLASTEEIMEASAAVKGDAVFLHCTSQYPGNIEEANLARMTEMAELLGPKRPVGLSDHTLGDLVPIAATALGAAVIEKHIKLHNPAVASEDALFSVYPDTFRIMVESIVKVHEAIKSRPVSAAARQFRRSLYAVADIKKGEPYTRDNVRSIRPGYGLPPKTLPNLLGRKARRDWRRGDPLS